MNEAKLECCWVIQWWGPVIGYAGENVSDESFILLICVPCEVCEHCEMLAVKTEKQWSVHNCCYFPNYFNPKSLKWGRPKGVKDSSLQWGWWVKWVWIMPVLRTKINDFILELISHFNSLGCDIKQGYNKDINKLHKLQAWI
jgi:hypothetical protein